MRYLVVLLLMLRVVALNAQSTDFAPIPEAQKAQFVSQMRATAAEMKKLSCSFVQQKHISVLTDVAESVGVMDYKQPGYLRWQYISPQQFAFVMDNGVVAVTNANGEADMPEQAKKMVGSLSELIMSMINGSVFSDTKNFTMSFFTRSGQTLIKLTPKVAKIKRLFTGINIIIDNKTHLPSSVEMLEKGGDRTVIMFRDMVQQ